MSSLAPVPESSFLYFTGNGSDKVYQAHLRQKDMGCWWCERIECQNTK